MILALPPRKAKAPPRTIQDAAKLFAAGFREAFPLDGVGGGAEVEVIRRGRGIVGLEWEGPGPGRSSIGVSGVSGYEGDGVARLTIAIQNSPRLVEITIALDEAEIFGAWLGERIGRGEFGSTNFVPPSSWPVAMFRLPRWGADYAWTRSAWVAVSEERKTT